MIRVKSLKPRPLTTIGTTIFTDKKVSLFARGIFCTAVSMAQRKGFDIQKLMDAVPDDPDKVYRGIMELRNHGYVKRVKVDGIVEFRFKEDPFKSSRTDRPSTQILKNKSLLIYSKSIAHMSGEGKQSATDVDTREDDEFIDWDEIEIDPNKGKVSQPKLIPERVLKSLRPRNEVIPKVAHRILQRICFMVDSEQDALLLSQSDRGRVASALGQLRDAGADLSKLHKFEDWWNRHWRSKDKFSGAYQPPRPTQVVELWNTAMKAHGYKPKPVLPVDTGPQHLDSDIADLMRRKHT